MSLVEVDMATGWCMVVKVEVGKDAEVVVAGVEVVVAGVEVVVAGLEVVVKLRQVKMSE